MRGKHYVVGPNFGRISSENDVELQNKILAKFQISVSKSKSQIRFQFAES